MKHKWNPRMFDPDGNYHGVKTCVHIVKCEHCHAEELLPCDQFPPEEGCVPKPKEKIERPKVDFFAEKEVHKYKEKRK